MSTCEVADATPTEPANSIDEESFNYADARPIKPPVGLKGAARSRLSSRLSDPYSASVAGASPNMSVSDRKRAGAFWLVLTFVVTSTARSERAGAFEEISNR